MINRMNMFFLILVVLFTNLAYGVTLPFLPPYETPEVEYNFADFNGNGTADLAVRELATGDVRIYFNSPTAPADRPLKNPSFETGTLDGWTKTGTAFDNALTDGSDDDIWGLWGHIGDFYVNTFFSGESATGTLQSDVFRLTSPTIYFRIGGWSSLPGGSGEDYNYVSIHVAASGVELGRAYAPNKNSMVTKSIDLGQQNIGRNLYIRVTDDADGAGFAWLSVDNFYMPSRPAQRFNQDADITASGLSVPDAANWNLYFADITGDGLADAINHNRTDGDLLVHFNTGSGFSDTANQIYSGIVSAGQQCQFADISGNGFADLVLVDYATGQVSVHQNTAGTIDSSTWFSQNLAATSSGWETLFADVTGDGRADLVNFNQSTNKWNIHFNEDGGFSPAVNSSFNGFVEKHSYQYFLADIDGDGFAEVVQLSLRDGDILARKLEWIDDTPVLMTKGIGRHSSMHRYIRPSQSRSVLVETGYTPDALLFYNNDYLSFSNRPDQGWWELNPNFPDIVPEEGKWRTTTPLLGLYDNTDPEVIKQHAYWMHSMGVNVVMIELTNVNSLQNPSHPDLKQYTLRKHQALQMVYHVFDSITEFVPPRLAVAMRMQEEEAPFQLSDEVAQDIYDIVAPYEHLNYKINDGTADRDKPVLVAFTDFGLGGPNEEAWKTTGPVWGDSRFNMRYTNGGLMFRGLTETTNQEWNKVKNDLPYWAFIESVPNPDKEGYYRYAYNNIPETSTMEQTVIWHSQWLGGFEWDGLTDQVDGKYTIERFTEPVLDKNPRLVWLNSWNYPVGWYEQPQEGLSANYCSIAEPDEYFGFKNFNLMTESAYLLRDMTGFAPTRPIIRAFRQGGQYAEIAAGNNPLEYRISADADGNGAEWKYFDDVYSVIEIPEDLQASGQFYLKVRNTFGESDAIFHQIIPGDIDISGAVDFSDFAMLAGAWGQDLCRWRFDCSIYDLTGDFSVGIEDIAALAESWLE